MTGKEKYESALRTLLSDAILREFLWRFLVEDCLIFQETFPLNANAYALLAKQELGKRLLADAKRVDLEGVHLAEKEYEALLRSVRTGNEPDNEGDV